MPVELVVAGLIIASMIIYFISYQFSKKIYRNKDFY
jgi:hypothetical protein